MTEKQKKSLEKIGINIIDLSKVSREELSNDDNLFLKIIESMGGEVEEIYHF